MTSTATIEHHDSEPRQLVAAADITPPPLITIVMANHNGARFIEAALRSALAQSLRDIEVIVADDASTDDSVARVTALAASDPRVRLLCSPIDGGPAAARNRCLDAARGRWIAILDSDDLMHPRRLEHLLAAAERDSADVVADDLLIFDDDPAIAPTTCLRDGAAFWVDAADYVSANTAFRGGQALGYLKPLIRAELIAEHGLRYDTTLRIAEDYDFILRLLLLGARFRVSPRLGYFYRKHAGSISHRLSRQTIEPMLAAHDRSRALADDGDARLGAALDRRRLSLLRTLDFDDLVAAVKRRDWRGAAALAMRQPSVAARLRGPLRDRLRRFAATRSATRATAQALGRPQVCVLSRQRIIGNTNGSSVYLLSICTALSRGGWDVHLLCPSPSVFGRWPWLLPRPEMGVFRSITVRRSIRLGPLLLTTDPTTLARAVIGVAGKVLSRLGVASARLNAPAPYSISQPWTRADYLFVAAHARAHADVVICDYAFLTEGIPFTLRPDALSLVVMHDLFSSRSAQFNRLGAVDSVSAIDQHAEMALLRAADAIVAIQPEEAAIVRACLPGHTVIVAPIAIAPVAAPQPGDGLSVLFVGSNTAPNSFGLRWFLEMIWPAVRSGVPDAALLVAGTVCGGVTQPPEGVRLLGGVRDLATLYQRAAVVVSPLQAGSGLKIKLIEALAHGKAVVATSVTLQGVAAEARGAVAVADDPAAFAAAVIGLLLDVELRMTRATQALELARTWFSPEACHADLLALVTARRSRQPVTEPGELGRSHAPGITNAE